MRRRSLLLSTCGIVAGAALWAGLATVVRLPPGVTDLAVSDLGGRLALALASVLPALLVLAAMIVAQMLVRFATGRFDPTSGTDARFLLVNQRVVTNTVEQLSIFVPALLALAARVSAEHMPQIIAAALTFAVARAVFWAGYLAHPVLRAPGMAATGGTNLATLAAACWVWIEA